MYYLRSPVAGPPNSWVPALFCSSPSCSGHLYVRSHTARVSCALGVSAIPHRHRTRSDLPLYPHPAGTVGPTSPALSSRVTGHVRHVLWCCLRYALSTSYFAHLGIWGRLPFLGVPGHVLGTHMALFFYGSTPVRASQSHRIGFWPHPYHPPHIFLTYEHPF